MGQNYNTNGLYSFLFGPRKGAPVTKTKMDKEFLLKIAEDSGLDLGEDHLKSLYGYIQGLRPTLQTIEDLDLTGFEPFLPSLKKE